MNILILKNTVADGRMVAAGQVVDVSESDARVLIRMGKASLSPEAAPVPAPVVLDTVETVAVVAEDKRKGRGRGNK